MFDGNGRFSFQIISADRSKSASNNPRNPVGQAVAYFGTYTVDEAAKTVTYHIERATFPQWDGINRTATSSTSSCAVASRQWTKATSVAIRRAVGMRLMA
jgi:hypothetical protein